MIAVSNTTPLRYLIAIGHENLLGQLFTKVFVPAAVHEELTETGTPEMVRSRILSLPLGLRFMQWEKVTRAIFRSNCIEGNARPFCWQKLCGPMFC
jgi:predicted nucleic acid-binding protein